MENKKSNQTVIYGSINPAILSKINIATPSYGSSYSGVYVRSLYKLLTSGGSNRVLFSFSDIDYADIVAARNYLISNFYFNKTDCSHILFVDDDMGFDSDLIYEMLRLKQDYVGVIAPKRKINFEKLHSLSSQSFKSAFASSCEFIGVPAIKADGCNFVEVDSCGAGILLISRGCIDLMIKKCPDIVDSVRYKKMPYGGKFKGFITPFNKIELEDRELSEDLSFAHRWTKICGKKIYANVSSEIEHVAEIVIKSKYLDLPEFK